MPVSPQSHTIGGSQKAKSYDRPQGRDQQAIVEIRLHDATGREHQANVEVDDRGDTVQEASVYARVRYVGYGVELRYKGNVYSKRYEHEKQWAAVLGCEWDAGIRTTIFRERAVGVLFPGESNS